MRISSKGMFEQQLAMLAKQYNKVGTLQMQMVSGKKIQYASEDPVLASSIQMADNHVKFLNNYKNNQVLATNRTNKYSDCAINVVDQLKHVKGLIEQAGNGTLDNAVRKSISSEIQGIVGTLLAVANTKDSDGQYIYSGFSANLPPYSKVNGSYEYQGGFETGVIAISPDSDIQYSEVGYNVFGDLKAGNGTFTVKSGPSVNTGTAYTSPGNISDTAAYVPDTYTINFVTNSNGKLAYQVTGATTGQVIPPPPAVLPDDAPEFTPNTDVTFNGMSLHISGQPNAGDQFTIEPSGKENMFNLLEDLATQIGSSINNSADQANYLQNLSQLGQAFDGLYNHMVGYQSALGARSNFIDNETKNNDNAILQQTIVWDALSSVDLAKVVSEFKQNKASLELSQETYIQIQQLFEQMLTGHR